jgi:predicted TIM-barrel fold metal-dependent hydrolase
MTLATIGEINSRRLATPGSKSWAKSVSPTDPDRHLMITIDSHVSEPVDVYKMGGIAPKYHDRLPKMIFDNDGRQFLWAEGYSRPHLVKGLPKGTDIEGQWERDGAKDSFIMWSDRMEPDDFERLNAGATARCDEPTLFRLHADMDRDGVDGAVAFLNRGLVMYATKDQEFASAMCHAWNIWAWSCYAGHKDRFKVAAQIAPGDIDLAIKELEWVAKQGFTCINIPNKPTFGYGGEDEIHYNHPSFDRFFAAVEALDLTMCMHVGTARDPRGARGSGGAIVNATAHFLAVTSEALAMMLASGVFRRFPKLRFVTVEADIGWIPWLLNALDTIYYKHHMWARPFGGEPPSTDWYTNCYASFIEDRAGTALAHEFRLLDNIMWSNDYPHNEGTWPHSQQAIERELQRFTEAERTKILGHNAARVFGFDPTYLLSRRRNARREAMS